MQTPTLLKKVFFISNLSDVVEARRYGLNTAMSMGFHQAEATKVAVVISELGRNIERYVGVGTITVTGQSGPNGFIQILAEDHGPGIKDVQRVLVGGYTTSKGMGLGLSGSKRLMDEFELKSTVGVGTTVRALKWLRPRKY